MIFHSDVSQVCVEFTKDGFHVGAGEKFFQCNLSPLEMVNLANGLVKLANTRHAEEEKKASKEVFTDS